MYSIELTIGSVTKTVNPMSLTLPEQVCSDTLTHVELSVPVTLEYDAELLNFLISADTVNAIVKEGEEVKFTGVITTNLSFKDIGQPLPVESISLTIKDNTYKLKTKLDTELVLLNETLSEIISSIAVGCDLGKVIPAEFDSITLPIFIIEKGQQYLAALNQLCFSYGYSFYFDADGALCFFNFDSIPSSVDELNGYHICTNEVSRQTKQYTGVKIGYNKIITKLNELVYYEGFGFDSQNKPAPAIIQRGVYFPFESSPIVEATEGQVYQSFESGFAEAVRKYDGELEYRRSKKTTLIYTQNHTLVEDWDGELTINRTEYESKRASVRFINNSTLDVSLYQLAIRADAWYRTDECEVLAGDTGTPYEYDAQYVYDAVTAKNLAKCLFKYFSLSQFTFKTKHDGKTAYTGTYKNIRLSTGAVCKSLCIAQSYDPTTDITYATWLTVSSPSVIPVTASKNTSGTGTEQGAADNAQNTADTAQNTADTALNTADNAQTQINDLVNGTETETVPLPNKPFNVTAIAGREGIELQCFIGSGVKNTSKKIIWELKKGSTAPWVVCLETNATKAKYEFDRATDGYPEASVLTGWKVRCKVINIYNKESDSSDIAVINVTLYGTWTPVRPSSLSIVAQEKTLTLGFNQVDGSNYYGSTIYTVKLSYSGTTRVEKSGLREKFYIYDFNRSIDGYPEKTEITGKPYLGNYSLIVTAKDMVSGKTNTSNTSAALDTSNYGTWIPTAPTIFNMQSGNRSIVVGWQIPLSSGIYIYGLRFYEIQISKDGTNWYKPETAKTGKVAETDWYNGTGQIRISGVQFSQALPLTGQTLGLPVNTTYYYRVRTIGVTDSYVSAWSTAQTGIALATGIGDIIEKSVKEAQLDDSSVSNIKIQNGTIVASEKVVSNTITTELLNVLAKNKINNFSITGTLEGWSTSGTLEDDASGFKKLRFTDSGFLSNAFTVQPNEICSFEFGISCPNYTSLSGAYIGLTLGQSIKNYAWNFSLNKWVDGTVNSYSRFIENYKSTTVKYYKTYILGSNVSINDIPAPSATDTMYTIYALQLQGTDTTARLRTGFYAVTAGTYWELYLPQVYSGQGGKIVAQQIVTPNLSSIKADIGTINAGKLQSVVKAGESKPNVSLDLDTEEFRVGNNPSLEDSNHEDAEYLHWKPNIGLFLKLKNLIVDALASTIRGRFRVRGTTAKIAQSILIVNPESTADPDTNTPANTTDIKTVLRCPAGVIGNVTGNASTATAPLYQWKKLSSAGDLYRYVASESPTTTYYWYNVCKITTAMVFDVEVVSDHNHAYRASYRLSVATYQTSSRTYTVALLNLGQSAIGQANLAVALDADGYLYIQTNAIWSSSLFVTLLYNTTSNFSITMDKLGYAPFGTESGFTPVKLIKRTGAFKWTGTGGITNSSTPIINTDIVGNVTGNLTGNVTGNITGNLKGIETISTSSSFSLSTYSDGKQLRIANTHATNTITVTLPSGQTMNGQATFTIAPNTLLEFELIGTAWKCVSHEPELLWTNPNPADAYTPAEGTTETTSGQIEQFKSLIFTFNSSASDITSQHSMEVILTATSSATNLFVGYRTVYKRREVISFSGNSVQFGSGFSGDYINQGACVPIAIYGVK